MSDPESAMILVGFLPYSPSHPLTLVACDPKNEVPGGRGNQCLNVKRFLIFSSLADSTT